MISLRLYNKLPESYQLKQHHASAHSSVGQKVGWCRVAPLGPQLSLQTTITVLVQPFSFIEALG